jgi:hypothetical protein
MILASGIFIFLFTNIEGSTKLVRFVGEKRELLRTFHHEMLVSRSGIIPL